MQNVVTVNDVFEQFDQVMNNPLSTQAEINQAWELLNTLPDSAREVDEPSPSVVQINNLYDF